MKIAFIHTILDFNREDYTLFNIYEILRGMQQEIDHLDIDYTCFDKNLNLTEFYKTGSYKQYDGIIGVIHWDDPHLQKIWNTIESEIPCVNILYESRRSASHYVGTDEVQGISLLVDHLVNEGFSKIGFFSISNGSFAAERYRGYCERMQHHRIFMHPSWVYGFNPTNGESLSHHFKAKVNSLHGPVEYQSALQIVFKNYLMSARSRDSLDAIIFETDKLAFHFFQYACEQQVAIPQDIAITGFDYYNLFIDPISRKKDLTTIAQNFFEIGMMAIRLLYELIMKKQSSTGKKILIPPHLVIHSSSLKKNRSAFVDDDEYFKNKVLDFIRANYWQFELAKRLSHNCSLTHKYFLVKFKKLFNEDFTQYINEYRLNKAAFFLTNTKKSVTTILFDVGFANHTNFNNFFKKRFGCTAHDYRLRAQSPST